MKKQLLFIFLNLSVLSFTQNFAPLGAIWHYGAAYNAPGEGFVTFESTQDTIVSGKNCRLLNQSSGLSCNARPLEVPVYDENNVVYFWDNNRNVFEILYDFNKQIGESWQVIATSFFSSSLDTITVSVQNRSLVNINGVDLIVMDVLYQNIYTDNMQYPGVIYERIGDLYFLYNHYTDMESGACDLGFSNGLRCYEDSTFGFYTTNPNKACDYNSLSIDEKFNNKLVISPNPSHGKFVINTDLEISQVFVYNSCGKLIHQLFTKEIDLSNLSAGVYTIEIQVKEEKIIRKIVIE